VLRNAQFRYRDPSLTRLGLGADLIVWNDEQKQDEDVPLPPAISTEQQQQQQQQQQPPENPLQNFQVTGGDYG